MFKQKLLVVVAGVCALTGGVFVVVEYTGLDNSARTSIVGGFGFLLLSLSVAIYTLHLTRSGNSYRSLKATLGLGLVTLLFFLALAMMGS